MSGERDPEKVTTEPIIFRSYQVNRNGAQRRYYLLSDLQAWFIKHKIPHKVKKDLWDRVVSVSSIIEEEASVA